MGIQRPAFAALLVGFVCIDDIEADFTPPSFTCSENNADFLNDPAMNDGDTHAVDVTTLSPKEFYLQSNNAIDLFSCGWYWDPYTRPAG